MYYTAFINRPSKGNAKKNTLKLDPCLCIHEKIEIILEAETSHASCWNFKNTVTPRYQMLQYKEMETYLSPNKTTTGSKVKCKYYKPYWDEELSILKKKCNIQ